MVPTCFIFIGRSGCGKGTQAKLLMDDLKTLDAGQGILYIQTGQELREFIKGPSLTQKLSKVAYDAGALTPEFLAVYVWINQLIQKFTGTEHIVFDGTPRKLHEAGVLNSIFGFYGLGKAWVINIDIDTEESVRRLLLRKRQDDGEAQIRKRLSWYETEVLPAIKYYENNPAYNFLRIDGMQSVEAIHEEIKTKILGK